MHRPYSLLTLIAAMMLPGCRPSGSPSPNVLDVLGGRAIQWDTVLSKDAWAHSRSPSEVPLDSLSYVGVSKAYGPDWRHDLYYVAIAGPSETIGRTLCEATAELTNVREVPGFSTDERVLVTETWNPDSCGWDLDGERYDVVYALSEDGTVLHNWLPGADRPADMRQIPDWTASNGITVPICNEPTIALTGDVGGGHPRAVCAPETLFGDAGFKRSDVPFWSED